MPAKQLKSFRLNPRRIKLLDAMTVVLGRRDGTKYSKAQVLERAIQCLWEQEFDTEDDSWTLDDEEVETNAEDEPESRRATRQLARERDI